MLFANDNCPGQSLAREPCGIAHHNRPDDRDRYQTVFARHRGSVAAPTAGGAGVLPAVLTGLARSRDIDDERVIDALATAGVIGAVIAERASLSGAEGGCQAETGAAAGMNPEETARTARLIRRVNEGGTTIVVVEHDMSFVMGLCRTIVVMNYGRKIADAPPDVVRADRAVIDAYLGVAHGEAARD